MGAGDAFKNIRLRSNASPFRRMLPYSRCPAPPKHEAEGGSVLSAEGSYGQKEGHAHAKRHCFILNWRLGSRLRFASAAMTAMEMCFL